MSNNQIIGVFPDESLLLNAMKKLKSNNARIKNLYGPCVDHDVLRELTPESRFSYFSFFVGLFTVILAFAAMYYISVIDYPLNFGGKPFFSFPPMVVVLFLVTILVTGVTSTLAFLGLVRLFPGKPNKPYFPGSLNDRYYLVIDSENQEQQIRDLLKESGAEQILDKDFNDKTQL